MRDFESELLEPAIRRMFEQEISHDSSDNKIVIALLKEISKEVRSFKSQVLQNSGNGRRNANNPSGSTRRSTSPDSERALAEVGDGPPASTDTILPDESASAPRMPPRESMHESPQNQTNHASQVQSPPPPPPVGDPASASESLTRPVKKRRVSDAEAATLPTEEEPKCIFLVVDHTSIAPEDLVKDARVPTCCYPRLDAARRDVLTYWTRHSREAGYKYLRSLDADLVEGREIKNHGGREEPLVFYRGLRSDGLEHNGFSESDRHDDVIGVRIMKIPMMPIYYE